MNDNIIESFFREFAEDNVYKEMLFKRVMAIEGRSELHLDIFLIDVDKVNQKIVVYDELEGGRPGELIPMGEFLERLLQAPSNNK